MSKSLHVLVGAVLAIAVNAAAGHAEVVRQGDQLKIRLDTAFKAISAHSGDGFSVTVPEGLKTDPRGAPEIPPGTTGTATFRLLEATPTAIKYDVSSFLFTAKSGRVEIKTTLAAGEATAGMLTVQKANPIKKLLLPPFLGFLIWKDTAILPAGKELNIEVAEQKRW